MKTIIGLCALAASLAPASAMARQCSSDGIIAQQVGLDTYDPAALIKPAVQISLRLSEDCEPENVALAPRTEREFTVRGPGGELMSRRLPSPSVQVSNPVRTILSRDAIRALQAGETIVIDLLEIQAGQFIAPGTYLLELEVILNGRANSVLPISIRVEPAIQLIGDAAAGVINLDLGDVRDGARAEQALYLRSNTRLSLSVVSEYGGRLQHQDGASRGRIPYTLLVNGASVAVESGGTVRLPAQSGQLLAANVDVRVAPTLDAFAGRYTDILTFSFVAD